MKTIEDMTLHGSQMMASQIRKAIEQKTGRFSNEDANWILDRVALLPSLKEWEKVEKCKFFIGKLIPEGDVICNFSNCIKCDNGIIRTPLQFEDMDWSELLRCAQYWSNFKLVTKSGEKIVRKEGK